MTTIAFSLSSLGVGGIQRVTTTIANALAKQGYNVTLLNASNADEFYPVEVQAYRKPPYIPFKTQNVMNRVRHKILHKITRNYRPYWVSRIFAGGSYDYLILNPEFFVFFDEIKRLHPESKIYLWMHNNYDVYVNSYFKDDLNLLMKAAKSADGIICLEHYTARKWGKINPTITVLHNPLTLPKTDRHCNTDAYSIAFVARLVIGHKGLDYLLDVAETLSDGWTIQVAGSGPDKNWMEEEIGKRKLQGKIKLHGALHDAELDDLYLSSSIFLMTSRWEGFPLVAAEAMSRGLPIVAFAIPALEEATAGGKYGLLAETGHVEALAQQLHSLMNSKEKRVEYSRLSLERAQAFDLDHIVNDWKRDIFEARQ